MYFDDYENYYNEPSEVDELFNEFSEKLKTMLKNEVIENAKKYDVNKDEIKDIRDGIPVLIRCFPEEYKEAKIQHELHSKVYCKTQD